MKVFVVDVAKCNGCYNCQVSCKDEHCGVDWMPYAKAEPMTGQFWCGVEERVRGTVPLTRISYIPHLDAQTDAIGDYAPEAVMEREDGIVVLDPAKCQGRKDIADKFPGVFWNEELGICQGCTGCAHLLDDGWTVPRCVDSCPTGALRFGEAEDFAGELEDAVRLDEKSHVYYLNYPKRFVGGCLVDLDEREVVIGADVALVGPDGAVVAAQKTDEFGDFMFDQVEAAAYKVTFADKSLDADATDADVNLGDLPIK